MLTSSDSTWAITGAMYWSVIETNVGILSASIPSWKVLAKRYLPRLLGSYGRGTSGQQGSGFQLSSMGAKGSSARPMRLHTGREAETEGRTSFSTHVGKRGAATRDDSSDEEALFTPTGRIGVKTEISLQYERPAK